MTTENVSLKLAQLEEPLNVTELTTAEIAGTGVFDVLMKSVKNHVQEEHTKSRITGKEYATVYLEALQSTMAQSIEYLLRAKTLGFELDNLGKQGVLTDAQRALIEAQTNQILEEVSTKLPAEVINLTKQGELLTQQVAESEYRVENVLPKELEQITAQVVNLGKQGELVTAQAAQVSAETELRLPAEIENLGKQGELITQQVAESTYRVANVLPKELEQITAQVSNLSKEGVILDHQAEITIKDAQLKFAQIAQTQAQTELTEQQVKTAEAEAHKIPVEISVLRSNLELSGVEKDLRIAQVGLAETEKDIAVYNLANRNPVEVELLQAQTDNAQSQIALTEAQVVKITEENKVIPYNIERIQAEIANMTRQSDILEKELEIKISSLALQDKQLLLADAELQVRVLELDVKRAEVESAQAQAQLYAAKVLTENAQTMDAAHPNSVLGSNIAVLRAQAAGYARDAEQKAAKILVDAWNVQRNTDESIQANAANLLYDTSIGQAVSAMLRGAGI